LNFFACKSDKIFDEKVNFEAAPKVDAKNEKYVRPEVNVKVDMLLIT
jgi:hypothetical protein